MHALIGDEITVDSHRKTDSGRRRGTVIAVLGVGDQEHYQVRWQDGHESTFFPGPDTHVVAHRP